jgi:hypothetical protein
VIRSLIFVCGVGLSVQTQAAGFSYEDCIINGMKGVQSDLAAGQVRLACRAKEADANDRHEEALRKKWGDRVEVETLQIAPNLSAADPGFSAIEFTNKNPGKTITVVRLGISPAPGGAGTQCDSARMRDFYYDVTIKPLEKLTFVFPVTTPFNCISTLRVLGREPSWSDIAVFSTAKPVDKSRFEE